MSGARQTSRISLERDERGGVTVHLDGSPQSHVQPDDPTLLVFEYVQHLALAIGVADLDAFVALETRDLRHDAHALSEQLEHAAVDLVQTRAQLR